MRKRDEVKHTLCRRERHVGKPRAFWRWGVEGARRQGQIRRQRRTKQPHPWQKCRKACWKARGNRRRHVDDMCYFGSLGKQRAHVVPVRV